MTRTVRFGIPLAVTLIALAFPSLADAQRRGGGGNGGRNPPPARGGTAVVRGGGGHVAVPRTYDRPAYSRPYYSHPYYYRPYYAGYYPRYYSPWSFSLSFGIGWYGGAYYAPFYAYPSYAYPSYAYPYAYPPYPYPYSYQPPYPPQRSTQPQYTSSPADSGYENRTSGEFGTLSMRVLPSDATIVIDGQVWDRPRDDDRFVIHLAEGAHRVEIRQAGYTTYTRTIDVPRGRPLVLNVALPAGGTQTLQVARTIPHRH